MPIRKIRQGDCIDQIAEKHGLLPDTVWDHPDNSELKTLRKDKNVLFPCDKLFVPDKEIKTESVASDAKHRFRRKAVPAKFRLQLKKNGEPRADLVYTLNIDSEVFEGKTDGDGWIEHPIPPGAEKGQLILTDTAEIIKLNLGRLDPLDQAEGVQQRLKNLGLYTGKVDGKAGGMTRTAIQFFQKDKNLI